MSDLAVLLLTDEQNAEPSGATAATINKSEAAFVELHKKSCSETAAY